MPLRRYMRKEVHYSLLGFVIGVVITGLLTATRGADPNMTKNESMTMSSMVDSLKGKTGDEFDKAFISSMIEHHQGAVDMAKLAEKSAKHTEITRMSTDIIVAQSKEIEQMKQWQAQWGYQAVNNSMSGNSR